MSLVISVKTIYLVTAEGTPLVFIFMFPVQNRSQKNPVPVQLEIIIQTSEQARGNL